MCTCKCLECDQSCNASLSKLLVESKPAQIHHFKACLFIPFADGNRRL